MENKIFGFTREELVDMFEPLSEIQENASDMAMDMQNGSNRKFVMPASTAEYKKNTLIWLQQKIMDTRMSKTDKQQIIDWIGGTIDMVFISGYVYHIKETGGTEEYAKAMAESFIGGKEA